MDKNKAIDRARKLLAMAADSSSPNEAVIAARRARSIIDKFQINSYDLEEASDFGKSSPGKARTKIPQWEQNIAIVVAQLNDCIANIERGKFQFKGFSEDAEVAGFMFLYIVENGKRTCKHFMQSTFSGCRNSFKLNYAWAIQNKIRQLIDVRNKVVNTSSGKSLVLVKKQLVEKEFGLESYRKSKKRYSIDPLSGLMGQKAGQATNIVTGLKENNQERISA